jgi:hypothetical protein
MIGQAGELPGKNLVELEVEYTKALERTMLKELGKITP